MRLMNKIICFVLILASAAALAGCLSPITKSGEDPGTASEIATTDMLTETNAVTDPVTAEETELPVTTEEIIEDQPIVVGEWMWREGYGYYDEGYHIPFGIYENVYFDKYNIIGLLYGQEMPQKAQQQAWEQMKDNPEVRNLPYIYLAVKNLGTDKSEFIKCNENIRKLNEEYLANNDGIYDYVYTDDEIEYLFGDYSIDETIEHLKAPWAYYYRGRLYTIFNIFQIENEMLIKEMYAKGNLAEYIGVMKNLLSGGIEDYIPDYAAGDDEDIILNVLNDFETLPLNEFQQKYSGYYGIGFDWTNYDPTNEPAM